MQRKRELLQNRPFHSYWLILVKFDIKELRLIPLRMMCFVKVCTAKVTLYLNRQKTPCRIFCAFFSDLGQIQYTISPQ